MVRKVGDVARWSVSPGQRELRVRELKKMVLWKRTYYQLKAPWLLWTEVAKSNIRDCEHWKSPTPGIYNDAFGGFDGTCI